ncbi:cyclin-like protein [Neocallimastix sp. 'constans']
MEYKRNKPKFPIGTNLNTFPYYNRNHIRNNSNSSNNSFISKKRNFNNSRNVNKNAWHFSVEELNSSTPSIKDGYIPKEEQKQRWKACAFIMSIGMTMKIPQITIATACTYLHRFYCRKSLKLYPPYEIAASSIFLASKVTDTQRRLKDLIIVCISKAQKNAKLNTEEKTHEFEKWKKTILYHEIELLETICCDIVVDHPYTHLLKMVERFNDSDTDYSNLVKLAWCFINDSYKTTMCLEYSPQVIAASSLYLTCKYNGTELVDKENPDEPWWKELNINEQELLSATSELADVYMRIIKRYSASNSANGNNVGHDLENADDALKRRMQNTPPLLSPENQNVSSVTSSSPPQNI